MSANIITFNKHWSEAETRNLEYHDALGISHMITIYLVVVLVALSSTLYIDVLGKPLANPPACQAPTAKRGGG